MLTETLEKSINGCYLRLLRYVLDINWKNHVPNKDDLPSASTKIKEPSLDTTREAIRFRRNLSLKSYSRSQKPEENMVKDAKYLSYLDTKQYLLDDVRDMVEWRQFVKRLL